MKYQGLIVAGFVVAMLLFVCVVPTCTYANHEKDLRLEVVAWQQKNEAVFDRVWKVIQQQAGVTQEYSTQFRAIYNDIMSAQNPAGQGTLLKFIQQSNPSFDSSLFAKLMSSIESNRLDFERAQIELIDRKREHDSLLQGIPSGWYLSLLGRGPVEIKIVTSSKTEAAFESGKDDDVSLFRNNETEKK